MSEQNRKLTEERCKAFAPNFEAYEFKCECNGRYCDGYPAVMDPAVLKALTNVRAKYGNIPVEVTSGMRCQRYNDSLSGSIPTSLHRTGRAVDFYIRGRTDTVSQRNSMMGYIKTLPNFRYTYANTPGMGKAIHMDFHASANTVGVPTAADKTKLQAQVKVGNLNGRKTPSLEGTKLGYMNPGYYNILGQKTVDGYLWVQVETNLWFAVVQNEVWICDTEETRRAPRTTAPNSRNQYYINEKFGGLNQGIAVDEKTGFVLANCVGYSIGRFEEIMGGNSKLVSRNAHSFWGMEEGYERGQTPKAGAILCYDGGECGHVANVEEVYSDGSILISDSAWGGEIFRSYVLKPPYKHFKYPNEYKVQGFIYNPVDLEGRRKIGTPVERNKGVTQVEVIEDNLRGRKDAGLEGTIRGLMNRGIYNVLETVTADGYTWCKVEEELWCALIDESSILYKAEAEDYKKLYEQTLKEKEALEIKEKELEEINKKLNFKIEDAIKVLE